MTAACHLVIAAPSLCHGQFRSICERPPAGAPARFSDQHPAGFTP
uniref:Uncharacterized protein n=1 Tax=Brevibacterium sp. Ap13 TaxID=1406197 RepID=U5NW73_9MICO|nr:hypothetical protein AP13_p00490 [Brevibacterium sp. Ap13]